MTRAPLARWLAAAALAGACAPGPPVVPPPAGQRLEVLSDAVAVRRSDPDAAARLFAAAGPGPVLEEFRFEAWSEALRASDAPPEAWRRFLEAQPPPRLRREGWRQLAGRLAAAGDRGTLAALLATPPPSLGTLADELAVAARLEPGWGDAALRLAERAPDRLRAVAPDAEERLVATLDPAARLRRAAAWAEAGEPAIARRELRGLEAEGEREAERRRDLARLELDRGSVSGALAVLPALGAAAPEDHLVRAVAYRQRGWSRVPEPRAAAAFRDCLTAARRAASGLAVASDPGAEARRLVVECGTEAGALDPALDAWRELEAAARTGERRDWLGRRLGVALALQARPEVAGLAAALEDHRRCLEYWTARSRGDGAGLERLAADPVADLYGVWARRRLGVPAPAGVVLAPAAGAAEAPFAVRWLEERGEAAAAVREWRRLAAARGLDRSEAVAAAGLAVRSGDPMAAIRFLLGPMPALGGPGIEREPADAVRAYLPLPYVAEIRAAAAESGVEPWLVAAVVRQESAFQPRARSPRNARGLMQLLAGTARGHGLALGLGPSPDLEDPAVNLRLGARELAGLLERWGAVEPALAAYNAGPSRVARWWRRWPSAELLAERIPIPETYTYVRRVVFLSEAYRLVYAELWRQEVT